MGSHPVRCCRFGCRSCVRPSCWCISSVSTYNPYRHHLDSKKTKGDWRGMTRQPSYISERSIKQAYLLSILECTLDGGWDTASVIALKNFFLAPGGGRKQNPSSKKSKSTTNPQQAPQPIPSQDTGLFSSDVSKKIFSLMNVAQEMFYLVHLHPTH